MLQRYLGLITVDGLDITIPISDGLEDEEKEELYRKAYNKVYKLYSKYGKQIFDKVFNENQSIIIRADPLDGGIYYGLDDLNKEIGDIRENLGNELIKIAKDHGHAGIEAQNIFNMREKYAAKPSYRVYFAMDDKDFQTIKNSVYNAFYLLDGMINGETKYGRFNDSSKPKTILILDKTTGDEKLKIDKAKLKKWRRIFYDKIQAENEEDPDEL
jgi:hypothetical protein